MKLDDFLKCKKVRCVNIGGHVYITAGKEYDVINLDEDSVYIVNDNHEECDYLYKYFEPVLESEKNPPQGMELTPEFEAVEPVLADNSVNIQDVGTDILDTNADIKDTPKFKVGDLVYRYGETDVKTVLEVFENGYMRISNYPYRVNHETLCHATPKNHAVLSKPFPAIEFEQPPKPLSGDELVRAMLKKGIKNVLCLWVNGDKIVIDGLDYKGALVNINNNIVSGLTPIDWCTGEPLTQAVLDE